MRWREEGSRWTKSASSYRICSLSESEELESEELLLELELEESFFFLSFLSFF
jgi:hypothetical protein